MDGSTLSTQAFKNMMKAFSEWEHKPSEGIQEGLRSIQETLTLMLLGTAVSSYYLSTLDPGTGKSTAITSWLQAYLERADDYGNKGVLIGLDRLEEIERYTERGLIPQNSFAVLVSDSDERCKGLNSLGLGGDNKGDALILFTTKAQIRLRSQSKLFEEVSPLYYKGESRQVKIWDESLSIGQGVILNPSDLGKLLTVIRSVSVEMSDIIYRIIGEVGSCESGAIYTMPELPEMPKELAYGNLWET
ncbi:MAG: hypothetical protein PHY48_15445, partial [Candidatus Cloacimonetes bacterium]|nr:hypothetical protein [Candidatus Cloacimonadota bacterium]